MSAGATPESQIPYDRYAADRAYAADLERGTGWVMFAGTLLMILGTVNFIEGIAAVSNSHFFVANTHYIAGDLKTWGWVVLIIGVIEWGVGIAVFIKSQFARWVGVAILSLNAIVQLMLIPAYPFWSLSIFAVDILAIFGLVAYGGRISRTA